MKIMLRMIFILMFCIILSMCVSSVAFADGESFVIPKNVTIIEDEAFSGCVEMKSVSIPAGVTRIGDGAFAACEDLKRVYFDGTQEEWARINIGTDNDSLVEATHFFLGYHSSTETMTIAGKAYTASYYGQEDMSARSNKYSSRDFWRLENAYGDFADCLTTGERIPNTSYPMEIEAGQVFIIDYTLKDGSSERRLMRCDGFVWDDMLMTRSFDANTKVCVETLTIGGQDYRATYYGYEDMSDWHEICTFRKFWRLENAYNDFQTCRYTGDNLPDYNYPMPIEAGQIYVIEYSMKNGHKYLEVMRCDGNIVGGRLTTHAIAVDVSIYSETMTINGKDYLACYFGWKPGSSDKDYSYREFWRLEGAYNDMVNCSFTGNNLLERNYPMPIAAGQVFVVDYSLKSGGISRQVLRCDGNLYQEMLETYGIAVD